MPTIRLGTRGSRLALRQAELVSQALQAAVPGISVAFSVIKTTGDRNLESPLAAIGDKGLFTKEIEQALLEGAVDLAVHSCKDLPSELAAGLSIGAVLPREDPRDALITDTGHVFEQLPLRARVGTSSLRRAAQLLALRPDLEIVPLRGNVETRIRKMTDERLDAVVLACAGVLRLGLEDRVTQVLPADILLPAAGQGAIAVEARSGDGEVLGLLRRINDPAAACEVLAERAFLGRLHGGCQVPVGCLAEAADEGVTVTGLIASLDGQKLVRDRLAGPDRDSVALGARLAEKLLAAGGENILREIRTTQSAAATGER